MNQTVEGYLDSNSANSDNIDTKTTVTTSSVSEVELPSNPNVEIPAPKASISSTVLVDVSSTELTANYVEPSWPSTVTENKHEPSSPVVELPTPTFENRSVFEKKTEEKVSVPSAKAVEVTLPLLHSEEAPKLVEPSIDVFTSPTKGVLSPLLPDEDLLQFDNTVHILSWCSYCWEVC